MSVWRAFTLVWYVTFKACFEMGFYSRQFLSGKNEIVLYIVSWTVCQLCVSEACCYWKVTTTRDHEVSPLYVPCTKLIWGFPNHSFLKSSAIETTPKKQRNNPTTTALLQSLLLKPVQVGRRQVAQDAFPNSSRSKSDHDDHPMQMLQKWLQTRSTSGGAVSIVHAYLASVSLELHMLSHHPFM